MVRWERYIQHGELIGEVQRKKEHGSVVGREKEGTGRGLGRGGGGTRSDPEGYFITKDMHTIILCQSWGIDIRAGVISRYKLDKQIDKIKNE